MPPATGIRPESRPSSARRALAPCVVTIACLVALLAVGFAWSFASPIGASPDDDFHLATIWCHAPDLEMCRATSGREEGLRPTLPGVRRVLVVPALGPEIVCYAFQPEVSASCQGDVADRSGLVVGRADDGLYPGGFHYAMSFLASRSVGRSVVSMRMLSWIVAVGLLLAAYAVADAALRRAFFLAVLATFVPLGVFVLASNNPSGVTAAGVAAFWCAAHALLRRDGPRWHAAAAAVAVVGAAAAVASRTDAILYLLVAAVAAIVFEEGYRRSLRRRSLFLVGVCAAAVVSTLPGGQADTAAGGLDSETDLSLGLVLFENALELPRLALGALGLGPLGWLDTPMPALVSVPMLLVLGGIVVAGVRHAPRQKWIALGVTAVALLGVPTVALAAKRELVGQGFQTRYLLPLLPVLAGTALLAVRGEAEPVLRRGQVVLLGGTVVVAHAAALHATIRRFVTGIDVRGLDLGDEAEWWWGAGPGPTTTWLIGSVAFAITAGCALYGSGWGRAAVGSSGSRPAPPDTA